MCGAAAKRTGASTRSLQGCDITFSALQRHGGLQAAEIHAMLLVITDGIHEAKVAYVVQHAKPMALGVPNKLPGALRIIGHTPPAAA